MTNPYEIEAIPTEYKGFQYRSKLEAIHAKFFDLLGLDFYYEPEVFEFPETWYKPDFRVFLPGLPARWIEVKGPELYLEADEKSYCTDTTYRRTGADMARVMG